MILPTVQSNCLGGSLLSSFEIYWFISLTFLANFMILFYIQILDNGDLTDFYIDPNEVLKNYLFIMSAYFLLAANNLLDKPVVVIRDWRKKNFILNLQQIIHLLLRSSSDWTVIECQLFQIHLLFYKMIIFLVYLFYNKLNIWSNLLKMLVDTIRNQFSWTNFCVGSCRIHYLELQFTDRNFDFSQPIFKSTK